MGVNKALIQAALGDRGARQNSGQKHVYELVVMKKKKTRENPV